MLDFYRTEYNGVLYSFSLPEEQAVFTALPGEMIELAKKDPTRTPIVIIADCVPVGFFTVQSGPRVREFSDNIEALLLIGFSINQSQQGKGYAKKGLELLPAFVSQHFPQTNEIVLAVNHKNFAAQHLYLKSGFVDRGQRRCGEIGEQLLLHLSL